MRTITRTLAGVELTLTEGVRYMASRPFARRGRRVYPVTIRCMDRVEPQVVVSGLDYERANALVNAFNNGPTSFDGRIW